MLLSLSFLEPVQEKNLSLPALHEAFPFKESDTIAIANSDALIALLAMLKALHMEKVELPSSLATPVCSFTPASPLFVRQTLAQKADLNAVELTVQEEASSEIARDAMAPTQPNPSSAAPKVANICFQVLKIPHCQTVFFSCTK